MNRIGLILVVVWLSVLVQAQQLVADGFATDTAMNEAGQGLLSSDTMSLKTDSVLLPLLPSEERDLG